jgi:replicative DNA helicase
MSEAADIPFPGHPEGDDIPMEHPAPETFTRRKKNKLTPEQQLAVLNRSMPFAGDAEQGVLSVMLQDPERISSIRMMLADGAMYHNAHRIIYDQILEFEDCGAPLDMTTLTMALRDKGLLEKAGGPGAISDLYSFLPIQVQADFFIKVVQDKHLLRDTIAACAEVIAKCQQHGAEHVDEDVLPLITTGEQRLFEMVERAQERDSAKAKTIDMREMVPRWVERMEHIKNMRGKVNGLQTGWVDVDRAFGGLGTDPKGDLVIIAGFPGMGKSVAAASVVESVGMVQQVPGTYFPLEMGVDGAMDRFALGFSGVDTSKARSGFFSNQDFGNIMRAMPQMSSAPIHWWEGSFISCTELRATVQIHVRKYGIKWIMIDHMGQIRPSTTAGKNDPRIGQVEIMETLHSIRHDFGITIFLCVQLAKSASDKRPNQPKQLSDLRGASEIGEYATHCIFIDRPIMRRPWSTFSDDAKADWMRMTEIYTRQVPQNWAESSDEVLDVAQQNYKEHALAAIAKNRHGATPDHICLRFQGPIQRFTNRSPALYSTDPHARQVELHGF